MIVEKCISVEYENHCASLDLCFSKSFSSFPSHPPQFYHCKVFVALQQSAMYIGTRSGCGKERHTCKIGIIGTNVSLLWLKIKYWWNKVFSSSKTLAFIWRSNSRYVNRKDKTVQFSPCKTLTSLLSVFQNDCDLGHSTIPAFLSPKLIESNFCLS